MTLGFQFSDFQKSSGSRVHLRDGDIEEQAWSEEENDDKLEGKANVLKSSLILWN